MIKTFSPKSSTLSDKNPSAFHVNKPHQNNYHHLSSNKLSPDFCVCEGSCPKCRLPIQAKLDVRQYNDRYEQEADKLADQLTDSKGGRVTGNLSSSISRYTSVPGKAVPGISKKMESKIHSSQGNGQPLAGKERSFYETSLGRNFRNVRIHTDEFANVSNRALKARAYTVENDIYFKKNAFDPHSIQGKRLLSHEMVHVAQQQSVSANNPTTVHSTGSDQIQRDLDPEQLDYMTEDIISMIAPNGEQVCDPSVDYCSLFEQIENLSMTELLQLFTVLESKGYLTTLEGEADSASEAFRPRFVVALLMVKQANENSLDVSSDELRKEITALSEQERQEIWNFYSLEKQEDFVDGLMAMSDDEPMQTVTAGIGGAPLFPGDWLPPGKQPIPFYIGNQAHAGIAAYYMINHIGEEVYSNTIPIMSLLFRAKKLGMPGFPDGVDSTQLALMPDITNLTRLCLYEIKPLAGYSEAVTKAAMYQGIFKAAGIPMELGPSTDSGTQGVITAPAGYYVFWSPQPGVILYQYGKLPPLPVPKPVPEKKPVPVTGPKKVPVPDPFSIFDRPYKPAPEPDGFMEEMEAITGLTGAALVIYLVVSEGSRLFPPRNLVPVP